MFGSLSRVSPPWPPFRFTPNENLPDDSAMQTALRGATAYQRIYLYTVTQSSSHFTECQHLKPPFQLPPSPMPSKHISPSANTPNTHFNCPHALKTHFTQCQHLKPRFQLPPCPQNTFQPVPTPRTPFSTAPMPSKHISPGVNTSNHLFNGPHALTTHFTQCQHLKPRFQLPPCPQNTFQPVPTPRTPFSTAPMPSKHISPGANTSNHLFNSPHALTTRFTQCQRLKPQRGMRKYSTQLLLGDVPNSALWFACLRFIRVC